MPKSKQQEDNFVFMAGFSREEYPGADPKGGEEKGISGVHHPLAGQVLADNLKRRHVAFREIRAMYHRPRERPCALWISSACNRWNAFPRPGAVFSRLDGGTNVVAVFFQRQSDWRS